MSSIRRRAGGTATSAKRLKTVRRLPVVQPRLIKLLSFFGVILLCIPILAPYIRRHSPIGQIGRASFAGFGPIRIDPTLTTARLSKGAIKRIVIPAYAMDVPVQEAPIVAGYWKIFEQSASHGAGSANPGEKGNIVVFAHAREGLFLPLQRISHGTVVYLLTDDRWHSYVVDSIKTVTPDKTEVIAPTPNERLTLFTCSGFLDSKRLVVTAHPTTL